MPRLFHPPLLREMHALRNEGVLRLMFQAAVIGGGSGAVIGCFRALYDALSSRLAFVLLHDGAASPVWRGVLLFGVLAAVALLVSRITRWEPLIGGSGIPQVELVLAGKLPMPWRRIVPAKFFGTLLSLAGGLSVGREGPSIQMGAAVGCGFGELMHEAPHTMPRYLVGGSVAGLTAAFGAPFAGLFFAFEEMKVILSVPLLLFTATAAATAWFVVNVLFGFGLVFPFAGIAALDWAHLWLAVPMGLAAGLLGVVYNMAQVKAALVYDEQTLLPPALKNIPPFLAAGCLFFLYPRVLNGVGLSLPDISRLAEASGGQWAPLAALGLLLAVKIAFSIASFASGVPGGLLMPMLGAGGMAGAVAGVLALRFGLLTEGEVPSLLVLGMTGLFAATVRAPLTGIALVAEMSGAYASLPAMILVALVSTATANRLGSPPVYDSLKKRLRRTTRAARRARGAGTAVPTHI